MVRIVGVEIPEKKKIKFALRYIYGIGPSKASLVLEKSKVDPDKRAKDLSEEEISNIQKAIEKYPTEGALRKIVSENIKRIKQIGSYRGHRHAARLPVRGQRTRSNARTKRGKRVTIGAMKKDMLQKLEGNKKETK